MNSSTNPPLPPRKPRGCFGKGCLAIAIVAVIVILSLTVGGYFFVKHSLLASKPVPLPIEELPSEQLADTKQRINRFRSNRAAQPETTTERSVAPREPQSQLELTNTEINGLIAANKRARGHAFVTLSGNAATVQLSIPADKLTGAKGRYLNGSFVVKTTGPTAPASIRVKKMQANGWTFSSEILQWQYRGRPVLTHALDAVVPYHIATIEIRDGKLIATRAAAE